MSFRRMARACDLEAQPVGSFRSLDAQVPHAKSPEAQQPLTPQAAAAAARVPAAPPPLPSRAVWAAWISDLPRSVHVLVALAVLQLAACVTVGGLVLSEAWRACDGCTAGGRRSFSPVLEQIWRLGAYAVLVGAAWAFTALAVGVICEEHHSLSASLVVSTVTAVLPMLLVPWGLEAKAPRAFWGHAALALASLLLQAAIVPLASTRVWPRFCWRSLKRFGCNRHAAKLRMATLRVWTSIAVRADRAPSGGRAAARKRARG